MNLNGNKISFFILVKMYVMNIAHELQIVLFSLIETAAFVF